MRSGPPGESGWGAYRQGRFDEAALTLERAVAPGSSPYTPGMLYWAARARRTSTTPSAPASS